MKHRTYPVYCNIASSLPKNHCKIINSYILRVGLTSYGYSHYSYNNYLLTGIHNILQNQGHSFLAANLLEMHIHRPRRYKYHHETWNLTANLDISDWYIIEQYIQLSSTYSVTRSLIWNTSSINGWRTLAKIHIHRYW